MATDIKNMRELGRLNGCYGRVQHIAYADAPADECYTSFKVYEVTAWTDDEPILEIGQFGIQEVATFSVKWDGCSHIGFRDPELGNEWVHVCGSLNMQETIQMLAWAWNLDMDQMKPGSSTDRRKIKLTVEAIPDARAM
jgi:hypothetical protein